MGKARMLGQQKPYTPNNKADLRYRKQLPKNGSTQPRTIKSLRLTMVSLVPNAEPSCRINKEKENNHG